MEKHPMFMGQKTQCLVDNMSQTNLKFRTSSTESRLMLLEVYPSINTKMGKTQNSQIDF